jgi:hypothetical protein
VLLRRRLGRIEGGALASTTVRVLIGGAVAGGVGRILWRAIDGGIGRSLPAQIVSLGVALGAATLAYLVACRLLQVEELRALRALVARRAGS